MKKTYFTVGPSQLYPTVEEYTQEALQNDIFSLNHRSKEFEQLYQSAVEGLKTLLDIPQDYSLFFVSSGTEAMERIIQNTVDTNSFHIVTGTFGDRFYQTAKELGKQPDHYVYDPQKIFSANDISVHENAELIAFTHNDTSTGMQIPVSEIYTIAEKNPDALIAVDAVSSLPYMDIDYSKVDCVFFSVQKGFGMPAGLGVLIVSPRALKKSQLLVDEGVSTGSYHSFASLASYAKKYQTPDTPNVFAIYLLSRVVQDMLTQGIYTMRKDTDTKADMLYSFATASQRFAPYIQDSAHQSKTTLILTVANGNHDVLQKTEEQGFIVGSGYGEHKDEHIRIANFPSHTQESIAGLIECLKSV